MDYQIESLFTPGNSWMIMTHISNNKGPLMNTKMDIFHPKMICGTLVWKRASERDFSAGGRGGGDGVESNSTETESTSKPEKVPKKREKGRTYLNVDTRLLWCPYNN